MSNHTGLYVSWEKSRLLIHTIQEILGKNYNTVAKIGPRLANNTCEIVLYNLKFAGADIAGAKHLVENYLKMIDESKPNDSVEKTPEVIELDCDEEITCITLDESLNETVSVHPNNSVNKSGHNSRHESDVTTLSSSFSNTGVDCGDKGSSISQLIDDSNPDSENTKDNHQDRRQKRPKRKRPASKDEDVVEVIDDDVIVLDDSFAPLKDTSKKKLNSYPCENLIDLTEIVSPSSAIQLTIPSLTPILSSSISQAKKTVNKVSGFLATASTSNTPTPIKKIKTKAAKAWDCPPTTCSSAFSKASPTLTNGANNILGECLKTNSTPETPSKKGSKLAYNRPAHLVVPLTKSSKSNTIVDSQSNIYNPNAGLCEKKTGLRPIVIDGNNVAIGHGKGQFSLKGIEICINYFEKRGHRQIKAFVPHYRTNRDTFDALRRLERQGTVVITPSRKVDGKVVASYDDRYIVQYATEFGGVIVSSDNFRDLMEENPSWKETIQKRLLMFTWVDDLLMFPQDPLGRSGPSLDEFLSFSDS